MIRKACLTSEYESNLQSINKSKILFKEFNSMPICEISNYFITEYDFIQNIGVFLDSWILPQYRYTVKVELLIPDSSVFEIKPQIVIFNQNWESIAKSKELSGKKNKWRSFEYSFVTKIKDVEKVIVAIHGRIKHGKKGFFYLRNLTVVQSNKIMPKSTHADFYRPHTIFIDGNTLDTKLDMKKLEDIAINNHFYRPGMEIRSLVMNDYLHSINKDLCILYYLNAEIVIKNSKLMEYIKKTHPEWLIVDSSGQLVEERGYPGNVIVDITNPKYVSWITDRISDTVNNQDYDGILLDMVSGYYYPYYYTASEIYSPLNGKIGDENWREGSINFVKELRRKCNNKLIIGNGIGTFNGGQYFSSQDKVDLLIDELDGVFIEEFAISDKDGKAKPLVSQLEDRNMLAEIIKKNKYAIVSTNAPVWNEKFSDKSLAPYLANYLLGYGEKSYIRAYDKIQAIEINRLLNKLGSPTDRDRKEEGGRILRYFNNGTVFYKISEKDLKIIPKEYE